jgi:hypothetical protein
MQGFRGYSWNPGHIGKRRSPFPGNGINPQERRMKLASGQPGLMIYYEAESPAVRALCFVKEVFDGVLDGLPKFSTGFVTLP